MWTPPVLWRKSEYVTSKYVTLTYWLVWIKGTYETAGTRKTLCPSIFFLQAGDKSPVWKVSSLYEEERRHSYQPRDSTRGICKQIWFLWVSSHMVAFPPSKFAYLESLRLLSFALSFLYECIVPLCWKCYIPGIVSHHFELLLVEGFSHVMCAAHVNELFAILLLICLLSQGLQPRTQKVKIKFPSPPSARLDTVGVRYWGPTCPAVTTDALSLVAGQTAFVWPPLCYFPPHSGLVCPNCGSGLPPKFLVVPWFSRRRFKNSPESRWLGWNTDTLFSLF